MNGQSNEMSSILSGQGPAPVATHKRSFPQRSSDIFSNEAPPLRTSIPINPARYKTQISFGEEEPVKPQVAPKRSQSQIFFGQEETPAATENVVAGGLAGVSERPPSRRDPNHASESDSAFVPGKKIWSGKSNESHFSLNFESEPIATKPVRKNFNETVDEPVVATKPSTRVLNPPGGRSNFVLG
jgi:hypothetical protein